MSEQKHYIYGINAVHDLIEHSAPSVYGLTIDESTKNSRVSDLLERVRDKGISVTLLSRQHYSKWLAQHCKEVEAANHQGVVAECKPIEEKDEDYLKALLHRIEGAALLLILDGVTDPHNLGACIRCANAAGAHAVIVPKDKAVGLTPVVRKVASGAAETTPLVVVKNLARCIKNLQAEGVWVLGAAGETKATLYQQDLTSPVALVMGSEGEGLRRLTRERCDTLFAIPMGGSVESLNVSVAAGVCLFEARRQRQG